jgi:hypothetical protein
MCNFYFLLPTDLFEKYWEKKHQLQPQVQYDYCTRKATTHIGGACKVSKTQKTFFCFVELAYTK